MRLLLLNYETALGSAVHATPVLAALRQLRPDWEVHVACAGVSHQVLAFHPGIHRLHVTPHPVTATLRTAMEFAALGLGRRFDAVLLNTGNSRARIAWNARFVRAGTRIGVGAGKVFADQSFVTLPGQSVAANNLQVLQPLIPKIELGQFAERFEVYWDTDTATRAEAFREQHTRESGPLIGFVSQTSGGQPSEWYDERFVATAKALLVQSGGRAVFFGSAAQADRIGRIVRAVGQGCASVAGQTAIPELGAQLAVCDLVISLDTGPMHIARAVGVPMVVIAPSWQPAWEWLPLGQDRIKVLRRWDIGCRHCRKIFCATRECMEETHEEEVIQMALSQLRRYPPGTTARQKRLHAWTTGKIESE